MISYENIRHLQQFPSGPDSQVLSLYVNVDQSEAANLNRGFETVVENLFRRMGEDITSSGSDRHRLDIECKRVLEFLKDYTPKGVGLVVFSDSKHDLWWQRDLQVNVETEGRWSPQPWVRPLLELLEDHDHFGVVLIDKQHAKILTVDATGINQHADIQSDVPNKHATTGTDHIWSQTQMDRDHTKHIKWYAKRVADELAAVVDGNKITRLVIGGPVEATTIFTGELPRRFQQMIIDTISIPIDAGHERLSNELRAIQERAEHADEFKLVESMITSAHKGDRAVLGISETLSSIQEGRVHVMVVAREYHAQGKECDNCRVLTADGLEKCSFCGGKLEPAPDLINRASHKVLDQGGRVQIVSGAAADRLSEAGVGAVLRF